MLLSVEDKPPLLRQVVAILAVILLSFLLTPSVAMEEGLKVSLGRTFIFEPYVVTSLIMDSKETLRVALNNNVWSGNGTCMPYARGRTGIEMYGSACTALERAVDEGYEVFYFPTVGSMMVTTEGGCGHVAAVESISSTTVTISEQNYEGPFIRNERTLLLEDEKILGYIR